MDIQKSRDYYNDLEKKEKNNWWYWGKEKILLELMSFYLKENKSRKILDLGCEIGTYYNPLAKFGEVIGIDYSYEALFFCKNDRNFSNVIQANGEKMPFKENSFDVIAGLDIFEHFENDIDALKEFNYILKPGGLLILFIAAKKSLWCKHDIYAGHKKRYEKDEVIKKISPFFKIEKITFSNFFIYPLVYFVRQIERKFPGLQKDKSDFGETILPIELLLRLLYLIEAKTINFLNYPFGVSLICVARKT